jgi:hypothetical protein
MWKEGAKNAPYPTMSFAFGVIQFELEAPLVFPWLILKFSHKYSGALPWYILKKWLIISWHTLSGTESIPTLSSISQHGRAPEYLCENFNINQGNTRGASNSNCITPNAKDMVG